MTPYLLVQEMKKVLGNMTGWLTKATAHAQAKKFEPSVLLEARIAPDMFPLLRQVQFTCDAAKFAAGRVANKEMPSFPDDEKTFEDLHARIAKTIAYLDTFTEADFAAADKHTLALPRWEGKSMIAAEYQVEHATPNFFFHATTTYLLLRHNGVDVGKRDFLGALTLR